MKKGHLLVVLVLLPWMVMGLDNAMINMFELPNGLKVIFCPIKNVEATAVCLYYLNGSRNDPPDLPGVSYFFQDLMFLGTANIEPLDHWLFVTQKGGDIGGLVNYDNTFFYQVVPSGDLPIALRYESERLRSLKLENSAIENEKKQILARIGRQETSIAYRGRQWVLQNLFSGSAYENPVYGDLERMKQYFPERVRDFYKNYQNPSNLILLVFGKMDVNDLRNKVNDLFQDIPGGYRSRSSFISLPQKERRALYKNWALEGLPRPMAIYGFPAPGRLSVDYFYFEFFRAYLAGDRISRLDYVFNQVNRLDIEIHAVLTNYFEGNALLIELTAPDRLSLEKAKFLFSEELKGMFVRTISSSEKTMTKNFLEIGFLKQMQSLEIMAQRIAEYYHMFGSLDFFSSYLGRIRKIDAFDIQNMAKKYLTPDHQVILNVYSKK